MCILDPLMVDLEVQVASEVSVAVVRYCNEVAVQCCHSNDNCHYDLCCCYCNDCSTLHHFLRPFLLAFDFDNAEVVGPVVGMHEKDNFDFQMVDLLNKVTIQVLIVDDLLFSHKKDV